MTKLRTKQVNYICDVFIPAVEKALPQTPENKKALKWLKGQAQNDKVALTVPFSSKENMEETRRSLAEMAEYLGKTEGTAMYWVLRYTKMILEELEALNELIRQPTLTFDMKTQLPRWKHLMELVGYIRNEKL